MAHENKKQKVTLKKSSNLTKPQNKLLKTILHKAVQQIKKIN